MVSSTILHPARCHCGKGPEARFPSWNRIQWSPSSSPAIVNNPMGLSMFAYLIRLSFPPQAHVGIFPRVPKIPNRGHAIHPEEHTDCRCQSRRVEGGESLVSLWLISFCPTMASETNSGKLAMLAHGGSSARPDSHCGRRRLRGCRLPSQIGSGIAGRDKTVGAALRKVQPKRKLTACRQ